MLLANVKDVNKSINNADLLKFGEHKDSWNKANT
jgi:hypothetical protein